MIVLNYSRTTSFLTCIHKYDLVDIIETNYDDYGNECIFVLSICYNVYFCLFLVHSPVDFFSLSLSNYCESKNLYL